MKNLFRRLFRRKGFTLVECLIAIAVFAALTMVVFAILTNARNASVRANETEENLSTLIGNVVGDESFTRYNENSDLLSLKLSTGDTDFRVSYTEIDGYKTFVICSACGYFADNGEFMTCEKALFTQTSDYICPKCTEEFTQELECDDCSNTAQHSDSTKFTYIPSTGGFYCNECGSSGVRGSNVNDDVISNDDLNVKTLVPNAIIYGDVEQTAEDKRDDKFALQEPDAGIEGTLNGKINMSLEYVEGANTSLPGTYKLRISSDADSTDFKIIVYLPGGYNIPKERFKAVLGQCNPQYDSATNGYYLEFYDCTTNGYCEAEFQLVNAKSGLSFELDYYNTDSSQSGLAGYWFCMNPNGDTFEK